VDPGQARIGFGQLEAGPDAGPKIALVFLVALAFGQGGQGVADLEFRAVAVGGEGQQGGASTVVRMKRAARTGDLIKRMLVGASGLRTPRNLLM
jgi:expansin (peptidoglycan-binding protein)